MRFSSFKITIKFKKWFHCSKTHPIDQKLFLDQKEQWDFVGLTVQFYFAFSPSTLFLIKKTFIYFSNFSCMFLNPNNLNSNCSNLLYLGNLQEQVKQAFCIVGSIVCFNFYSTKNNGTKE